MFTWFALLIGSFVLGALHALEPGHGKTLVAAYLVGSRGRWYHAIYLGLVVTVTHTAGIVALGLLAVYGMGWLDPDLVVRWTQLAAGGLIVLLGGWLLYQQLTGGGHHHHHHDIGHHHHHGHSHHHHDHAHDHDHQHEHGRDHAHDRSSRRMSGWGLTLLGITGGILPCPAALAPLLGGMGLASGELAPSAVHVHTHDVAGPATATAAVPHEHPHAPTTPHVHSHPHDADHPGHTDDAAHAHARTDPRLAAWRGVWAVLAFSAGLATTLTVIGLIVVRARGWAAERFGEAGWVRHLPFISAVLVTAFGAFLLTRTLMVPSFHMHVHG